MVGVKAVVVLAAVRELDIDGQETGFYELEIEQQPSRSAIAVNKRMDGFEFEVEQGCGFQYVLLLFPDGILLEQLIDSRFYHIGLGRCVECSDDADRDVPLLAAIFSVVH